MLHGAPAKCHHAACSTISTRWPVQGERLVAILDGTLPQAQVIILLGGTLRQAQVIVILNGPLPQARVIRD
jgi:hypothetical protein